MQTLNVICSNLNKLQELSCVFQLSQNSLKLISFYPCLSKHQGSTDPSSSQSPQRSAYWGADKCRSKLFDLNLNFKTSPPLRFPLFNQLFMKSTNEQGCSYAEQTLGQYQTVFLLQYISLVLECLQRALRWRRGDRTERGTENTKTLKRNGCRSKRREGWQMENCDKGGNWDRQKEGGDVDRRWNRGQTELKQSRPTSSICDQ